MVHLVSKSRRLKNMEQIYSRKEVERFLIDYAKNLGTLREEAKTCSELIRRFYSW